MGRHKGQPLRTLDRSGCFLGGNRVLFLGRGPNKLGGSLAFARDDIFGMERGGSGEAGMGRHEGRPLQTGRMESRVRPVFINSKKTSLCARSVGNRRTRWENSPQQPAKGAIIRQEPLQPELNRRSKDLTYLLACLYQRPGYTHLVCQNARYKRVHQPIRPKPKVRWE